MIQYMIDQCFFIKQKVVVLSYGINLTTIFKDVGVSLDGEEGQDTFMNFTAKTISQLCLTSNTTTTSNQNYSESSKHVCSF
jgi:hypothetical protein